MKKLILFAAFSIAALTAGSCASEDDGLPENKITFTVDGVKKTYTAIDIERNGPEVIVKATTVEPTEEYIQLKMNTNDTGAESVYEVMYFKTQTRWFHAGIIGSLISNLQINSNGRLKGTFSGNFEAANDNMVVVTNGKFDMSY
ncbi:hypothetical protein [Flavobacterium sp. 3HN19-14]|uniref:hypothetical protein n=1 Tax=Flavobacterium sp. 3HN19-14 TaxID=3448133 RepID=UPI003EE1BC5E